MDFTHSIIAYYQGEKAEAAILTFFGGLVFLIMVLLKLYYPTELAKGLVYPVSIFVLIALSAGSFNVYNNAKRLKEMPVKYIEHRGSFVEAELARFEGRSGVNTWWLPLNITWSILVLAGVALFFYKDGNFSRGVAIGLVFLGFSGLLIDGFARERAEKYTKELYSVRSM
jgi:hypothetical protein